MFLMKTALAVVFGIFGCLASMAESTPSRSGEQIVVTVNGTPICEEEVEKEADNRIDAQKVRDAPRGLVFEESARAALRDALRNVVIHALVERALIAGQLQSDGIEITDAEVDARFTEKAKAAGQSAAEAIAEIEGQGRMLERIKERIRWNELGVERLYTLHDLDKDELTVEEAEKIYYEYPAEFDRPERRRVSHILVRVSPEDSVEQKLAARRRADSLRERLNAPEDFATLAQEYSEDAATKAVGGDRGWSTRGIIVPPYDDPFGNAAFALKDVGDLSPVVESRDGYHIIRLTGLENARRLAFDEVKEQLIADFRYREIGKFWEEFGEQLRRQAKIEYSPQELEKRKDQSRRQAELNQEIERRIAAERARQESENAPASASGPSRSLAH
jgi:parvulin-like peptidyl-prolyl isomerase